jgi:hypothetical protein
LYNPYDAFILLVNYWSNRFHCIHILIEKVVFTLAVSSSKCNRLGWIRPEGLEIKSAFWKEKLCGAFPPEGFPGADIQGPGDGIEFVLRVDA